MTINIDADQRNADWIKTLSWEFPTDPEIFLQVIGGIGNLEHFLELPVAEAMPLTLKVELSLNHGLGLKLWDERLHPRDTEGRFTDTGAIDVVRLVKPLKGETEPRELPAFDITPAAQDEIYTRLGHVGITHGALASEIGTRILAGGQDLLDEAEQWYPMAKRTAGEIARNSNGRLDLEHAEALIAAMSPQMEWDANVLNARRMADWVTEGKADNKTPEKAAAEFIDYWFTWSDEHHQPKPFLDMRKTVASMKIATGGGIDENLRGLKVRSFFNNIDDPGGTRDVTVDTHMVKVFQAVSPGLPKDVKDGGVNGSALGLLNAHSPKEGQAYGGAGYIAISEAVRAVSTELGIAPGTVQAAYWLAVRDTAYEDIQPESEQQ